MITKYEPYPNLAKIRTQPNYVAPFKILTFETRANTRNPNDAAWEISATLGVIVGNKEHKVVGDGTSEVDALCNALKKSLVEEYPQIAEFCLGQVSSSRIPLKQTVEIDHHITMHIEPSGGGKHKMQPLIITKTGATQIEATLLAVLDAFEPFLLTHKPASDPLEQLNDTLTKKSKNFDAAMSKPLPTPPSQ